ncbi:MAG: DUF4055 domain-containing protein [Shewanella sp.]
MPIQTVHPRYADQLDRWRINRAACAGQDEVKKLTTVFLPDDNATDRRQDARERYKRYLMRATWFPCAGYTKQGMLGMVFRRAAEVELPNQLDYAMENVDGSGLSLEQFAKMALVELIEVGRVGVLVDYPSADPGLSAEQVAGLGLAARITKYRAESIDNWRLENIGGTLQLTMVKLQELAEVRKDDFLVDTERRYRVLRLVDGVYTQTLYNEKEEQIGDVLTPRQSDGSVWGHIPFHIIGATTNSPEVDDALISGIVDLNTSHYQMSADSAKNLHIHSGGTLILSTDMSPERWAEFNPNGVTVGADQGLHVGPGGSASLLQLNPASAVESKLAAIESQMIAVGAHLISDMTGLQTAEAARIDASSKASALSTAVGNLSEGLEAALEDMARFMAAEPEPVRYSLNQQFYPDNLDAQTVMAMIQLMDRQVIAVQDVRAKLRGGGMIAQNRTDDDIDGELTDVEPLMPVVPGSVEA